MKHVLIAILLLAFLTTTSPADSSGQYSGNGQIVTVVCTLKPTLGLIEVKIKTPSGSTTLTASQDPNGDGLDVDDSEEGWIAEDKYRFKNGKLQHDGGKGWKNLKPRSSLSPSGGGGGGGGANGSGGGSGGDAETLPFSPFGVGTGLDNGTIGATTQKSRGGKHRQ
jgi:hypothetical protein